jgi:hypothetical protein
VYFVSYLLVIISEVHGVSLISVLNTGKIELNEESSVISVVHNPLSVLRTMQYENFIVLFCALKRNRIAYDKCILLKMSVNLH